MKKLTLLSLLLVSTFYVNAQTKDTTAVSKGISGNNELKINLAYTIGGFPELNYERILKDDMSVGVAVLVAFEDDYELQFAVIPNYRIYFGNKKANGFFIEGNMAVVTTSMNNYYYDDIAVGIKYTENRNETNFGLGAAAGAKFLTKNGFVGEVYLGAGRLFGSKGVGG
ncbi:MAG: hypothetical protein EOO93_08455, partial [Pedobacter sp.]